MSELLDKALKLADEAEALSRKINGQEDNVIEGDCSIINRTAVNMNSPFVRKGSDKIGDFDYSKFEGKKIISSLELYGAFYFEPIGEEYDHDYEIYIKIKEFSTDFGLPKEDYLKLLINVLEKGCKYKENENLIARDILTLTNAATYIDMMLAANRNITEIKASFIEKANREREAGISYIQNIMMEDLNYSKSELGKIMEETTVSYFSEDESLKNVRERAESFAEKNSFGVDAIHKSFFEEAMHKMAERLKCDGQNNIAKLFLKYGNVDAENYDEAKRNRVNQLKSYQEHYSM